MQLMTLSREDFEGTDCCLVLVVARLERPQERAGVNQHKVHVGSE